ncbi:MAG: FAD-linked oxidase C-terminal domain-containing protein [Bacteroidota bacterium]
MNEKLPALAAQLQGELHYDRTMRILYATDASAYQEMPLAVAIPHTTDDIKKLIAFAHQHKTSLIPRTAGTSLAGQVVGDGIVVDVSRNFTKILEINTIEKWVRVQPGVVRDELNIALKEHGLFFGPETSTANRAMIGGMVGNNSCGSNSVVYGSTRDHLISVKAILSDGTETEFTSLTQAQFESKCAGIPVQTAIPRGYQAPDTLERRLYQSIRQMLADTGNQTEIRQQFPKKSIRRRNTGYAIDELLETAPFTKSDTNESTVEDFNFCKLIAGSEGTLAFLTEIKLNVVPLPPREVGLVCVHFNSIDESLRANLIALKYNPSASELIDHYILECTKENIEQSKNRFFVQGDPGAILVVEFARETRAEVEALASAMQADMEAAGLGYYFPLLFGEDTKKIWTLRKAGLGLLTNMPGDAKPVAVIEDTAVDVQDLPAYIRDFNDILKKHGLYSVHYAHAGSGELHLRPIINLKTEEGNRLFRTIAEEIATLVKKYDGSLSGEHGDGRLRGEFIRQMVGEKNYHLFEELKRTWDPDNILNPGKIVNTPPMHTSLRYTPGQQTPAFKTVFNFGKMDVLQHAEQCNGSGDCRKTELSGGTMCPSYMATRNEKDTTRARANILREFLTNSDKANRFDHEEIKEVMDLCLSCKGCKGECPSNVDVAKLKAEFLQHYYDANGIPLRTWLIGNFTKLTSLAALVPWAYNFIFTTQVTANLGKKMMGFAADRSVPLLHATTLRKWFRGRKNQSAKVTSKGKVYLFCDEFTNYNDTEIGIKAVQLLEKLGYEVAIPEHLESGRTYLSKGLLRDAQKIVKRNVALLKDLISDKTPLVGVEPSAILTFRDEYLDLAGADQLADAQKIADNTLLFDEFIAREIDRGNIKKEAFTQEKKLIKLHGHCQQKALSSLTYSKKMLSLPENYTVHMIPSGCCGMAGSFGYEKEHYDLSMKVGELVLFPTIRQQPAEVIIAAPGTSCRHQIKDGTGRKALHTIEILWEALIDE